MTGSFRPSNLAFTNLSLRASGAVVVMRSKRFFCAKDLRECFLRNCGLPALLREIPRRKPEAVIKASAPREVLPPKPGVRMTEPPAHSRRKLLRVLSFQFQSDSRAS